MGRNLLLLGTVTAFMCALLEGVLRWIYPVPPPWLEPQIRHLRSPMLGWVLPPGARGYTIDAPVTVNALGLRDDDLPREKPPGELRVLCLGDSFTFALGVRFEDLYAQQLETRLRARLAPRSVQVINAGIAGYNTRQELVYLLSEGLELEPDVVTIGFYWNDLIGNEGPLPDLHATPRITPSAAYYDRPAEHRLPQGIRDALRRSVLLYHIVIRSKQIGALLRPAAEPYTLVQRAILDGDDAFLEPYWRATGERLLGIAQAAKAKGIPVILVVFPDETYLKHGPADGAYARRVLAAWGPAREAFIDLEPAYRVALRRGENPFLPYDLHPNATGMRLAADALEVKLAEAGLLSAAETRGVIREER